MLPKAVRKTTAIGVDCVKPTDYQIRSGHIVVPRQFYKNHQEELAWKDGFTAIAFGEHIAHRKIDYDRRLSIRLRDNIQPGELIRLTIKGDQLVIEKA